MATLEERIAAQALDYVVNPPRGLDPVINLATPEELQSTFAEAVALGFDNDAEPHDDDSLVAAMSLVIEHSISWTGVKPRLASRYRAFVGLRLHRSEHNSRCLRKRCLVLRR